MLHLGIDFGAKLSGKTAVCFQNNQLLEVVMVEKGKDADKWIDGIILGLNPSSIFVDAPLTLPSAYFGRGSDFFYRECDRQCHAMSPMFLGGLTARAMAMAKRYPNSQFIEAYPKQAAIEVGLTQFYKNNLDGFLSQLTPLLPLPLGCEVSNWHQADAVLAWLVGHRYLSGGARAFGHVAEGQIWA